MASSVTVELRLTLAQLDQLDAGLVLRLKHNGARGDGLRSGFRRGEERALFAALNCVRDAAERARRVRNRRARERGADGR